MDTAEGLMSFHNIAGVDSEAQNENDSIRNLRLKENRIFMYKSILNYYKGRSLTLDYILASKQPTIIVPPDMRTYEALCKDIQGLHDDITLFQSMKNCLTLINCSLACTEIMTINDNNFRREIMNKIEGIIHFSRSFMKFYGECYSESDLIEKMRSYSSVLNEYTKSLQKLKESDKSGNDDDTKGMEKAEQYLYKINLMRIMKLIFIAYISLNCPDLLGDVLEFKTSVRRNLTIHDFRETWNIGYPSHECNK